jgi:hypothetical protein
MLELLGTYPRKLENLDDLAVGLPPHFESSA